MPAFAGMTGDASALSNLLFAPVLGVGCHGFTVNSNVPWVWWVSTETACQWTL
jgi:hypothetical protein